MTERLGGKLTPEIIFMTALAMLLDMNGNTFTYSETDLEAFRAIHGETGQLGIQVEGDRITVFVYDAPVARA